MSATPMTTVLVIGASGSIGQQVVAESLRAGYTTRALVRDPAQAALFPEGTQIIVGDPTHPETLAVALETVSGIVFTQGTYRDADADQANYRPTVAVLEALKAPARIALMTALGVTKPTVGHDWKRRAERLVRASGLPYTIVRPGWFDYNAPDEQRLVFRQGDTHWAGNPRDGAVSRQHIAQVLVASLTSDTAASKTFELVAEQGATQDQMEPLFAQLAADTALDGPQDRKNLPLDAEPQGLLDDLTAIRHRFTN